MTNVRTLALPQWRRLAAGPHNRCLIPLTEFFEWTPEKYKVGKGTPMKRRNVVCRICAAGVRGHGVLAADN